MRDIRNGLSIVVMVAAGLWGGACRGAEPQEATAAVERQPGLAWPDWVIIGIYGVSTIALGFYCSRTQHSAKEYFIGSGNFSPLLIGVSLFATLLSTISYLSMPGEVAGKGPVAMVGLLALPLVYFVVSYFLLPVYMRQRVTSAYELLEERLGLSVRLLGATMFLVLRLVWMTLLIYLAAKATAVMMGVDAKWIPLIVLITGFVSVIYTSLGGLRAVVVTDFMQTVLLFGGALLVLVVVTYDNGGFSWFPTTWQPTWDQQPLVSLDPRTRVTVVGTVLSILVWYTATMGGDQTSVQRFMATRDVAAARRALGTQLITASIVQVTLFLVGFALLSYFTTHRDQLPDGMTLKQRADDLFPHFISYHLPVGVSGLVAAAMFAAAMSSVDSGVNSITAVVMTDFVGRFGWSPKTNEGHMRAARWMALGIGAVVVLGSSLMKYIEGNITAVTNKTVNLLTTPIFALFCFALFIPRARALGVWAGAFVGTLTALAIAFSAPLVVLLATRFQLDPAWLGVELMPYVDPASGAEWTTTAIRQIDPTTGAETLVRCDPVSFQWIGPMALGVNLAVGTAVSLLLPGGNGSREGSRSATDSSSSEA